MGDGIVVLFEVLVVMVKYNLILNELVKVVLFFL